MNYTKGTPEVIRENGKDFIYLQTSPTSKTCIAEMQTVIDDYKFQYNGQRLCHCLKYFDDLLDACKNVLKADVDIDALKRLIDEIDAQARGEE